MTANLKENFNTWCDAFNDYTPKLTPKYMCIIDNMQVLHECNDSRDNHFWKRVQSRESGFFTSRPVQYTEILTGSMDYNEQDIMNNLHDIDSMNSWHSMVDNVECAVVMDVLKQEQLFSDDDF